MTPKTKTNKYATHQIKHEDCSGTHNWLVMKHSCDSSCWPWMLHQCIHGECLLHCGYFLTNPQLYYVSIYSNSDLIQYRQTFLLCGASSDISVFSQGIWCGTSELWKSTAVNLLPLLHSLQNYWLTAFQNN